MKRASPTNEPARRKAFEGAENAGIPGGPDFCEDEFDLGRHKKEAAAASRQKTGMKRAKRLVAIGKAATTAIAVGLFVALFFAVMGLLGL